MHQNIKFIKEGMFFSFTLLLLISILINEYLIRDESTEQITHVHVFFLFCWGWGLCCLLWLLSWFLGFWLFSCWSGSGSSSSHWSEEFGNALSLECFSDCVDKYWVDWDAGSFEDSVERVSGDLSSCSWEYEGGVTDSKLVSFCGREFVVGYGCHGKYYLLKYSKYQHYSKNYSLTNFRDYFFLEKALFYSSKKLN